MSNIDALFFMIFCPCFHVSIIVVNLLEMADVTFSNTYFIDFPGNSAMARSSNAEGSSTERDYGVGTIKAGFCAHIEKQHPIHGQQLDGKFVDAS